MKPNLSMSGDSRSNTNQGRFTGTNVSLRSLITRAYGIRDYQLEAPDWTRSAHFDIAAKIPDTSPQEGSDFRTMFQTMLQHMLEDRFKVAVHREMKSFSVYELVVARSGIKFKEVPDNGSHHMNSNNSHLTATGTSMGALAEFLSQSADRPVLDRTELRGVYDVQLDWAPESDAAAGGKIDDAAVSSLPPLPAALEHQLGLKLAPAKAPIQVFIVDHAEKAPTEN